MSSSLTPAIVLNSGQDPLDGLLETLEQALRAVGSLDLSPVVETTHLVLEGFSIAEALIQVFDVLVLIGNIVVEGLQVLVAVPFLEWLEAAEAPAQAIMEALNTLKTVFDDLKTAFIARAKELFKDIAAGVDKFQAILHTASTTIPDALSTAQILSYLVQVADPLVSVLEGSQAGDDLGAFVRQIDGARREVANAVQPLASGIDVAHTAAVAIKDTLEPAFRPIKEQLANRDSAVGVIVGILRSVGEAFHHLIDGIAPLRWLLDAVEWLMNRLLKPIVDAILDATGLRGLIDQVEKDVLTALGFGFLAGDVKDTVGDQASHQEALGSGGAERMHVAFSGLTSAVKQYRTNHNAGLQQAALTLVEVVIGTPVDPSKDPLMPDWPEPPDVGPKTHALPMANPAAVVANVRRQDRLDSGFRLAATLAHPPFRALAAPKTTGLSILAARATVNAAGLGADWQPVKALSARITAARQDLEAASAIAPRLQTSLETFAAQDHLPATFAGLMDDMGTIFTVTADLVAFVEGQYAPLRPLLEPFKANMRDQAQAASTLKDEAAGLPTAAEPLVRGVQQALAAAPVQDSFQAALGKLDAWNAGAVHLVEVIDFGLGLDTDQRFTERLEALRGALNAAATALMPHVEALDAQAKAVVEAGNRVQGGLQAYGVQMSRLAEHGHLVHDGALPGLHTASRTLNTLDAIFDPLSALLGKLECGSSSASDVKPEAAREVKLFEQQALEAAEKYGKPLGSILGSLEAAVLPLGRMREEVQAVKQAFSAMAFQQDVATLAQKQGDLAAALVDPRSYEMTDPQGQKLTVTNPFVDQAFAAEATQLMNAIAEAYPPQEKGN